MVLGSSPVAVTSFSDFAPASSKEFLDIQATIECGFTLKRVRDMNRTYSILARSCDKEYLIFFALKRQLTNKSVVNKQQICPALVNAALQKLAQINSFYRILLFIMSGKI